MTKFHRHKQQTRWKLYVLLILVLVGGFFLFYGRQQQEYAAAVENWLLAETQEASAASNVLATPIPHKNRTIGFVHVGKAGGNTVREALPRLSCQRKRKISQRRKCWQDTERPDSPLANGAQLELHMEERSSVTPIKAVATSWLWALRNPITRVRSAYHYLHSNNTASLFARMQHVDKDLFYQTCFPTWDALLTALQTMETVAIENRSECQTLALAVLRGYHHNHENDAETDNENNSAYDIRRVNQHLYFNYEYYYQSTIQKFPSAEVLVVRTESLWDDLQQLDRLLGGPGRFPTHKEGRIVNANKQTAKSNHSSGDNENITIRLLCCVLWHEFHIVQTVVQQAINLTPQQKAHSLQELYNTCQMPIINQHHNEQPATFDWSQWYQKSCTAFVD